MADKYCRRPDLSQHCENIRRIVRKRITGLVVRTTVPAEVDPDNPAPMCDLLWEPCPRPGAGHDAVKKHNRHCAGGPVNFDVQADAVVVDTQRR
jgi:hypothetical protein